MKEEILKLLNMSQNVIPPPKSSINAKKINKSLPKLVNPF